MKRAVIFSAILLSFVVTAAAQDDVCLTPADAKKVIESLDSPAAAENKKLRAELLAMREERGKLDAKITGDVQKNQALIPEANQMGVKHLARVCRILKENGWIAKESVSQDGFEAFVFLITNNKNIRAQQELLPVLVEAAKKSLIGNPLLASMVDGIRVGTGLPQIFGTQAAIRNNVVYLHPIQNEEKVDEWRKMYGLLPLAHQIRVFEAQYQMPVLKSQRQPTPPVLTSKKNDGETEILGLSDDEDETISVETRLVNLNVRVLTQGLKAPAGLKLTKDDFTVIENGAEQEIAFFSNTEQPFDLVLLLDFSGSTVEKRGLIKKAAQRFVELVRPGDRVAVVVFASDIKLVSELSGDKQALDQAIRSIQLDGASSVWDSLKFVYDNIFKEKTAGRRSAVVFMTDAEDNSLHTTFADAVEIVRRGETTIFPVYIGEQRGYDKPSAAAIRKQQQMLSMLAEESGGQSYSARNIKDLSGIYEQVVNELGQIYSIGYEPKTDTRDGGWRTLEVRIKNQPNLVTRTRRGYYAN